MVETGDVPVCKHWRAHGSCPSFARCPFQHPPGSLSAWRQQQLQEQHHQAALAGSSPGSPHLFSRRNPRRSQSLKSALRASAFCRFLVDTLGPERLRQGAGVLDVAGGRGEVACELLSLHAVPATVLEPRLLELRKRIDPLAGLQQRATHSSFGDPSGTGAGVTAQQPCAARVQEHCQLDRPQQPGAEAAGAAARAPPPDHLRLVVTPALTACLTASSLLAAAPSPAGAPPPPPDWPAMFQEARRQALERRWAGQGSSHEPRPGAPQQGQAQREPGCASSPSTPSCPAGTQLPARVATPPPVDRPAPKQAVAWSIPLDSDSDDEGPHAASTPAADAAAAGGREEGQEVLEIRDPAAAWRRLTECSAVVGMHPDQATDFIVELAVAFNKPFAVVPCCVYADSQAPRLLPCGRRVATYNDLLQYLVAKDPEHIRVATLPFNGRNKVVYRIC